MKKKKNNYFFIILLFFLFIFFLFVIYKPYNYSKKYTLNEFKIEESYSKKDKYYKFIIQNNNITYSYLINSNYYNKRKLINKIEVKNNEDEKCLEISSDYLDFYILCNNEDDVYTYNLSKVEGLSKYEDINYIDESYKDINIYYLNNKKYLLYNYKGFYLIYNKKEIPLFDKDIYNLELVYYLNNYVLVPNYNDNYYFDKFYLINMNNGKVEEIKLKSKISFNSVFLGDYKNNIYFLDKKEEKEYIISIKKKKVEETDFYILENNKLVKKNFLSIVNNSLVFNKDKLYNYEIINNKLYQVIDGNKVKLSNLNVNKIIKIDNETVYYLVKDNLYMYNNTYGEVLLLNNFEWNFKNTNMIFISE